MTVSPACGNCRHFTPPLANNGHGICNCPDGFVGTLRPEPLFFCKNFEPTTPRRLPGDEDECA